MRIARRYRHLWTSLICCSLLTTFGLYGQDEPQPKDEPSTAAQPEPLAEKVVIIALEDSTWEDSRGIRDWEQLLEAVDTQGATAVVFDLDIKNDLTWQTQERILESLSKLTVPTTAYVNSTATGSGALMAIGSDQIYMSEAGIIGGAGVAVEDSKNKDVQERQLARQLSLLKARARSLAKVKGHRQDVVENFIDSKAELKIGEETISPEGEVLTLTADEAIAKYEGKPLLAKAIAKSIEAVVKQEKLKGELYQTSPSKYASEQSKARLKTAKPTPPTDKASSEASATDSPEEGQPNVFSKRTGDSYEGKIVIIEVGMDALSTGKARFEFMDRTVKKAELDKASAVIFDIDTPGGYSWYTNGLILNSLQNVTIPTYSFVNTRAFSAGSIIAIGTDEIYMRPAATIGSALTVTGNGDDIKGAMESKVTQAQIAIVRNMAELKGHNPDIAEAFVTMDKEVVIDGTVIHEAGEVLNLNTSEATEMFNGEPVLAKGVVNSIEEIVKQEGIKGEIYEAQSLGMEKFAHWVQRYSFILIIIGIAGVYLEMKTPGFALPGLIGLGAFALFFFGNNMAGKLAGYELAVIFVLGLILILVEIFLFPGTMVAALVGGALILVSLSLAVVDRVDLEWKWGDMPDAPTYLDLMKGGIMNVCLGIIGGGILIGLLMRFLPQSRFASPLILSESVAGGASIDGQVSSSGSDDTEAKPVDYTDWTGEATTDLRPAGKGRFKGKLLDITADGEYLEKGTELVITKHEGSRIVVREKKA